MNRLGIFSKSMGKNYYTSVYNYGCPEEELAALQTPHNPNTKASSTKCNHITKQTNTKCVHAEDKSMNEQKKGALEELEAIQQEIELSYNNFNKKCNNNKEKTQHKHIILNQQTDTNNNGYTCSNVDSVERLRQSEALNISFNNHSGNNRFKDFSLVASTTIQTSASSFQDLLDGYYIKVYKNGDVILLN
jgi:hypothetical protein